jgi:hypothetical protein
MKAHLMHRDRDFDLEQQLPPNAEALIADLELDPLLSAMAAGEQFLYDVARSAMLAGLDDPAAIRYRQAALGDALEHPAVIRELYDLGVEALTRKKRDRLGIFGTSPSSVLSGSVRVMEVLVEMLARLREIAERNASAFRSEGFSTLFATLASELDDEYFGTVADHLRELRFRGGVPISAELGRGNGGAHYILHRRGKQRWRELVPFADRSSLSHQVADRDEAGSRFLGELRDRGLNLAANALAQSADHIASFFNLLVTELAFYVGCLNLHERIAAVGGATCFPDPSGSQTPVLAARGLYDPALRLSMQGAVVGNDVEANDRTLLMITGANQGGKSTFLRSVGIAQLMMQAGTFVTAESLRADLRDGIFTHFKREEDVEMESGKLDEELSRMSEIVDRLRPRSMLLCNESFASTNEAEGSEIARQILRAVLDSGVKVLFVTHMYDLAESTYSSDGEAALFLRAERKPDGRRTFRVLAGAPMPTSFGADIYRHVFGVAPDGAAATGGSQRPAAREASR